MPNLVTKKFIPTDWVLANVTYEKKKSPCKRNDKKTGDQIQKNAVRIAVERRGWVEFYEHFRMGEKKMIGQNGNLSVIIYNLFFFN